MREFGLFNRRESPTQTRDDALEQMRSGEVWGRTPRGGMCPQVQAYAGLLRDGSRGIQFSTNVAPHKNGSPYEVRWYLELTEGVELRKKCGEDFACIAAEIENFQP